MFKFSKRHLAKTVSWRIVGTLDTLVFALLLTGDMNTSLSLSGYTIITKMIWYYLHERAWFRASISNANSRHLIKTFTLRGKCVALLQHCTDFAIFLKPKQGNPCLR